MYMSICSLSLTVAMGAWICYFQRMSFAQSYKSHSLAGNASEMLKPFSVPQTLEPPVPASYALNPWILDPGSWNQRCPSEPRLSIGIRNNTEIASVARGVLSCLFHTTLSSSYPFCPHFLLYSRFGIGGRTGTTWDV